MYSEEHCIITISGKKSFIEGRCLLSDKMQKVSVKTKDYESWVKGEGEIEKLMPYLTKSEVSFLKYGVTDEGWNDVVDEKVSIPKAE